MTLRELLRANHYRPFLAQCDPLCPSCTRILGIGPPPDFPLVGFVEGVEDAPVTYFDGGKEGWTLITNL